MSYILDALQKSEQERQQQKAVPTISAAHETPLTTATTKLSTAWWLVIILSILLVAIIGYLLLGKNTQPNKFPTTINSNAQNEAPAFSSSNTQQRVFEQAQPQNHSTSADNNIPPQNAPREHQLSTDTPTQSKISQLYRSAKETRIEQDSIPVILPDEKITEIDLTTPTSTEINQQHTQNNEPEIPEVQAEQKSIFPTIYQLPDVVQSEIPPIQYIAHVYSSDVSKGFVILNNVKLTPGRRLQGELYLEKVDQDHVVMSFKGYLFTLPSMTNWDGRY